MSELCPDCQVDPGVAHRDGCDVARCLHDGGQRLMHAMGGGTPVVVLVDGHPQIDFKTDGHDCGEDVWTGRWPGEAECEEFGWWAYFVPNGNPSFRPCGPDDPGAVHDLNRLVLEARWEREATRWVLP